MRRLYTAAGKPRSIQSTPIIAAAAFALVVIVHHNTVCSVYPAVAATSSSFATPAAPLWRALGADRGLSSLQALQQSEDTSDRGNGKITIWNPDRPCSGTFASGPAPNSPDGFPYAIIREAVIDRRYASRVQFRRQTGEPNEPFERLVLYVTVHLSVTPSLKNASVSLVALDGKRLKSADGMIANVDVVQKVFSFSEMPGPYTPGMLSKRGHEVHEWQVIVSLRPGTVAKAAASDSAFMAHLQEMATNAGAALQLSIPLQRFDGEELFFTPAFSLSCVIGWEHSAVFPKDSRFHSGRTCTKGAQDSIVLGSNALYGIKRHDASHYREIAHFAARTMYGSMRFDAVAMPVIVNNTQSEANLLCGGNEECLEGQRVANRKLLESVAETVEQELDALGVPRSLFNKIIFVPACRLGSHATGSELGEPCSASQRYGQHHVTFFTYTLFSSYFKVRIELLILLASAILRYVMDIILFLTVISLSLIFFCSFVSSESRSGPEVMTLTNISQGAITARIGWRWRRNGRATSLTRQVFAVGTMLWFLHGSILASERTNLTM